MTPSFTLPVTHVDVDKLKHFNKKQWIAIDEDGNSCPVTVTSVAPESPQTFSVTLNYCSWYHYAKNRLMVARLLKTKLLTFIVADIE
jgi:hypothetical protein